MTDYNINDQVTIFDSNNVKVRAAIIALLIFPSGDRDYGCASIDSSSNRWFDTGVVIDKKFIKTFHDFKSKNTKLIFADLDHYIDKKFTWLSNNYIQPAAAIIKRYEFQKCKGCQERVDMAEPNQSDGSFICWSCRNYPYRNSF